MDEVKWERLFPDQLEARFATHPLLYLPYGMCEPHGPHNVLGLDGLKAQAICVEAAKRGGGIVGPTDWWHVHELGHYAAWAAREVGEVPRKWLSAMPPWQHFKNVCYHIRAADQLGFKGVILLTGHYGPNWKDLQTLVELIQPHIRARLFGLPDFEAAAPGFDGDGAVSDHAGKVETSLLAALEPGYVDLGRLPPEGEVSPSGHHFAMGSSAPLADRRIGEKLVGYEAEFLANAGAELIARYDRESRGGMEGYIRTFADVEAFWRQSVEPLLAGFASMEGYETVTDEVAAIPASSVWSAGSTAPNSVKGTGATPNATAGRT